jgi:hypothetical protein
LTLIKPELLETIRTEAAKLAANRNLLEEDLGTPSALLEFTEEAFDQSLYSLLGIHVPDFTQAGKEEVLGMAQKKDKGKRAKANDLLNLYVDVCNIWPDVMGESYGGSPSDFLEFRTELVPDLLSELARLTDDAKTSDEAKLHQAILDAQNAYLQALAGGR